ncbi:peptidase inhibitor family I36 protein [Mobiluncus mulieris]|uniref:Peptidase inhibitor family I36 protein n=1 Tax=Mobiluncus mulieris TaxID=2052 RepID=A0A7Y0U088_9ACTO|nr:peptidase inhibitor family I36 protein [Mobiluncus mulieris]NMW64407.1 peptidase inhibitor family I36 protein [Mobiluncus mulieris]
MKTKLIGFGMTVIAAISFSLLSVPAATAVDETTEDNLTLLNPVEEQSEDTTTTTNPSDETVVPAENGIAIRQYSGCPVGYACIWQNKHYNGRYWFQSNHEQVTPDGMNNKASSAAANGSKCRITRFYDSPSPSGAFFMLDSQQHGRNYQDPNLSNGAGYGKNWTQNWENRISYILFDKC